MTPKEKAQDLVIDFHSITPNSVYNGITYEMAKECALITVDNILESFNAFMDSRKNFRHELEIDAERYWNNVKKEIEKL